MIGVKFSRFTFKGERRLEEGWSHLRGRKPLGWWCVLVLKWYENEQNSQKDSTLARFQKPVGSGDQMSCLSVLQNHFFPLYHHGAWPRSLNSAPSSGMLQGVAVWADSSHACGTCVPSSELLLISCFSSMGEHCYIFHIKLNFQM